MSPTELVKIPEEAEQPVQQSPDDAAEVVRVQHVMLTSIWQRQTHQMCDLEFKLQAVGQPNLSPILTPQRLSAMPVMHNCC